MQPISHHHIFLLLILTAFLVGWSFFFIKTIVQISASLYQDFPAIVICILLLSLFVIVLQGFIFYPTGHPLFDLHIRHASS